MNFLKNNLKLLVVTGLLFFFYLWLNPVGKYNVMVNNDETTNKTWGYVETAYQERMDLIPNLVEVVKGYAKHEKETLEGVINARSKATSVNIDPSNMTQEQMKSYQANQDGLTSALSKLMVVVEKYPDLKANKNFEMLQGSLESMENKIRVERNKYNDKSEIENKYLKTFPNNILNRVYEFKYKPYFESQEGAEDAPKVIFTIE